MYLSQSQKLKIIIVFPFLFYLIIFLFFSNNTAFSQINTVWSKEYGTEYMDHGYSVFETNDNGYLILGDYYWSCIWLLKTNFYGDTIWTKKIGNLAPIIGRGYSMVYTSENEYVIAGETFVYDSSGFDIWLIKINDTGDTLWTKTIGGIDDESAYKIIKTKNNQLLITGTTSSFGNGNRDVWLIKMDTEGDTIWTKTYGGTQNDWAKDVLETDDGYLIAANTESYGKGESDIWIIKTNINGDTIWTKTFGTVSNESISSVILTNDGGYLIVYDDEPVIESKIGLVKLDNNGEIIWQNAYRPLGFDVTHYAGSITKTEDNGYLIAGAAGIGNLFVTLYKTTNQGELLWYYSLGIDGTSNCIKQNKDGDYIIVGSTGSFDSMSIDILVIKISLKSTNINDFYNVEHPNSIKLSQNYPNPFNPTTTIEFDLPKTSEVTLKVFNILGEEVTMLVSDRLSAGNYTYEWSRPAGMASGVYLYRLSVGSLSGEAGEFVETRKMILMR